MIIRGILMKVLIYTEMSDGRVLNDALDVETQRQSQMCAVSQELGIDHIISI